MVGDQLGGLNSRAVVSASRSWAAIQNQAPCGQSTASRALLSLLARGKGQSSTALWLPAVFHVEDPGPEHAALVGHRLDLDRADQVRRSLGDLV